MDFLIEAPNEALIIDFIGAIGAPTTSVIPIMRTGVGTAASFPNSRVSGHTYFTSLAAAQSYMVSNYPDFAYNTPFQAPIELSDLSIEETDEDLYYNVGDAASLKYILTNASFTFAYEWVKDGEVIAGANTGSISTSSITANQFGTYECYVTVTDPALRRRITFAKSFNVIESPEPIGPTNAIGATDPYGYIATGRGSGTGPDDLNPSYISLIDTTYTESELELYVPTTATVISYNTSLPSPYKFDTSGNCFNGTDYEMEIRVAATGLVLTTITVPLSTSNPTIYWY